MLRAARPKGALTPFVVTAPAGWQVLSNQAAESPPARRRRRRRVTFAPTLPLSSYITAIAAGPYHRVDVVVEQAASSPCRCAVLCRASLRRHLDADEILELTTAGPRLLRRALRLSPTRGASTTRSSCPSTTSARWRIPGCVTFTEAYVFRGAATARSTRARANTILHEMAHMWFGDLVTMTWWDDLWLKESFADYMGVARVSAAATEFTDAWVAFANRRKAWAYLQDQLPTTHPIVADIADLEAAKLNFDGITYAKGASGAQAARRLRRPGRLLRRSPPLLRTARLRQHHPGRPAHRTVAPTSGRDLRALGAARGCRPPVSPP